MEISAMILDDHPLVAAGLRDILLHTGHFDQVDICHSLEEFIALENPYTYHYFMVDISLGDSDGRTIIRDIRKKNPESIIISVSSHDHPRVIQSAFKAGADSYLLKSSPISVFVSCISNLVKGEDYIPPDIQKILTNHLKGKTTANNSNFPDLTSREIEILQLITEELTSKEIAEKLYISEHTVESHRASLFMKFDVKNIAGLVKKAILNGMVD